MSAATFVIKRSTATEDIDGEFVEGTADLLGRLMQLTEMPRRDCLDVVYKAQKAGTDVLAVAEHGSPARDLFGGAFFVVKMVTPPPAEHHHWCSCEQC